MLWKRLRVLGSVAHYHPKCQSGTSTPHLDSVCVPVGKICIIRIVFQSLKVIAKGFYMGEHLSSNWNRQSIYLLHVKYLQKCSLLCKHWYILWLCKYTHYSAHHACIQLYISYIRDEKVATANQACRNCPHNLQVLYPGNYNKVYTPWIWTFV